MNRSGLQVAMWERLICVRGGWIWGFAAIFGLIALALAIVSSLMSTSFTGFGFDRTTATLLNVMLLLVPLISLILGANAVTVSRGQWEMLLSQPISVTSLVTGKWLGVWIGVGGAIAVSLGGAGLVVALLSGSDGINPYLTMGAVGVLLSGSCVGIGVLLGVVLRERMKALVGAVLLWLVLVFVYDWAVIGVALLSGRRLSLGTVWALLALNPADLSRVLSVSSLATPEILGPTGAVLARAGSRTQGLLWICLGMWVALPTWVAGKIAPHLER